MQVVLWFFLAWSSPPPGYIQRGPFGSLAQCQAHYPKRECPPDGYCGGGTMILAEKCYRVEIPVVDSDHLLEAK